MKGTFSAERPVAGLTMRALALGHGVFYVSTGVWPFASRRAFERVTGPKTDWWLVQTVGVVVAAVGLALCAAARRPRMDTDIAVLAVASSLGLAGIDVVHVARGRLRPVYLADAAAELVLAAAWLVMWALRSREERSATVKPKEPTAPAS